MAMTCDRIRELASGFVLGALDLDDMIAVQDHLDACGRPHPEIDELGGVVPYLAQGVEPLEPPTWLRESVIAAARADSTARRRVGKGAESRRAEHAPIPVIETAASVPAASPAAAKVVPLHGRIWARRARIVTWSTRIAAALLVFSLAGYAYAVQNNRTQGPLYAPQPSDEVTTLKPLDTGSKAAGVAFLQQTGHIFLTVNNLPATSGDQVYVVWASAANGDLTKVGAFTMDASGWAQLEFANVPNSSSLWLFVRLEVSDKVDHPPGPVILSGLLAG
jgi:hypothetical protein